MSIRETTIVVTRGTDLPEHDTMLAASIADRAGAVFLVLDVTHHRL